MRQFCRDYSACPDEDGHSRANPQETSANPEATVNFVDNFQSGEAEAPHSSISCLIKQHDVLSSSITVTGSSSTGKKRTKSTYCSTCYGCPNPRTHTQKQKIIYFDYVIDYEHRYPFGSWSFCHTHSGSSSRLQWVTVSCGLKCI